MNGIIEINTLETRSKKKDGRYPIAIQITKDRKIKGKFTGKAVYDKETARNIEFNSCKIRARTP